MFVNGIPMLTSIDKTIRFRALVPLPNRTTTAIYTALDKILRQYNKAGFKIKYLQCDNEFRPLMETIVDDLDIYPNYTSAGEHESTAERNNRTIGERIRTLYHLLPYKALPGTMLRHMAMHVTQQLNYFPAKGGISKYYSPHVILTEQPLDYNKHCQVPFGAYVQGNQDNLPTNTLAPRTIDAIYLRPMNNKQAGHEIMDVNTGRVITRNTVHEIPISELIIKAVEDMAESQNMKSLKLTTRIKTPLLPNDWTAGVDYENNNENEYENENENEFEIEDENYNHYDIGDDSDNEDEDQDYIHQNEIDELFSEEVEQPTTTTPDIEVEDEEMEPETVEEEETENEEAMYPERKYPGRTRNPPDRLGYHQANKVNFDLENNLNKLNEENYSTNDAALYARLIHDINKATTKSGHVFSQQYKLKKGLQKYGEKGKEATMMELDQLHKRNCFTPINIDDLKEGEKKKAMEALMFLTEKRDKKIKGRMVYNGKPTREWLSKEDSKSPTVAMESIFLTTVIDAKENRDIMTADIPNAFIQTEMPKIEKGDEKVIMKITGVLVDLLVDIAPEVYEPYVVMEKNKKVIYVQVLRALYGMLVAALLWYQRFREDLESHGFEFNPYDPCVANKKVKGSQQTIRFHVDDLMSSHRKKSVNDDFLKWLNKKYGNHGEVKATRGKTHDYLGMVFDFNQKGKVTVDMTEYVQAMVDEVRDEVKEDDKAPTPSTEDLFHVKEDSPPLSKQQSERFHTLVAKGLFACKRARPDINTTITGLCTRVKAPNEDDWKKLIRLMKYLNGTRKDKLTLSAEDLHLIKWFVDVAFGVHADFRSHTGGTMTFGEGAVISFSRKQRLNTRSSTEAELVGADDVSFLILWTKLFMEAQGYEVKKNILLQDNKSTILLEENGKRSSSQRTCAINIRYFFLTDQIEKGNVTVKYCPTKEMTADFFSKPLQGGQFKKFKSQIMGGK